MTRRSVLFGLLASLPGVSLPGIARAFGQQGAFHARQLTTAASPPLSKDHQTGLSHWAWELVRRTSAPGRLHPDQVAADDPELLSEPFCVWAGGEAVGALMATELRGLRNFFQLGGVLFVDDTEPDRGDFGRSVRAELARVLPSVPRVELPERHVIYKSYYLVERPVGRVQGPPYLEAMIRGRAVQVLFSSHDLLGALARRSGSSFSFGVEGGDAVMRQRAIRLAVNIAMYVLCSDYKDDQVHAEELMRRRGRHPAR